MTSKFGYKDVLTGVNQKLGELKKELEPSGLSINASEILKEIESLLEQELYREQEGPGISAQVSLYPLRVKSLTPVINDALQIFKDLNLDITPGSMSTIINGNENSVWQALRDAFNTCAARSALVMTITVSNACPLPNKSNHDVYGIEKK